MVLLIVSIVWIVIKKLLKFKRKVVAGRVDWEGLAMYTEAID